MRINKYFWSSMILIFSFEVLGQGKFKTSKSADMISVASWKKKGMIYSFTYLGEVPNGPFYALNSKRDTIEKGTMYGNKRVGKYQMWDKFGCKVFDYNYDSLGNLHGKQVSYNFDKKKSCNKPHRIYSTSHGKLNGRMTIFLNPGELWVECAFKNGFIDGHFLEFWPNGKIRRQASFVEGQPVSGEDGFTENGEMHYAKRLDHRPTSKNIKFYGFQYYGVNYNEVAYFKKVGNRYDFVSTKKINENPYACGIFGKEILSRKDLGIYWAIDPETNQSIILDSTLSCEGMREMKRKIQKKVVNPHDTIRFGGSKPEPIKQCGLYQDHQLYKQGINSCFYVETKEDCTELKHYINEKFCECF